MTVHIRQLETLTADGHGPKLECSPAEVLVGDEMISVTELRTLAALLSEAAELLD